MENYFTDEEIAQVDLAFSDLTKANVYIKRHKDGEQQRDIFFDKAKLWRVIQRIIAAMFIDKLANGSLELVDMYGSRYQVTKLQEVES